MWLIIYVICNYSVQSYSSIFMWSPSVSGPSRPIKVHWSIPKSEARMPCNSVAEVKIKQNTFVMTFNSYAEMHLFHLFPYRSLTECDFCPKRTIPIWNGFFKNYFRILHPWLGMGMEWMWRHNYDTLDGWRVWHAASACIYSLGSLWAVLAWLMTLLGPNWSPNMDA